MSRQSVFNITLATPADVPELQRIYAAARRFMASTGNARQWIDGYPSVEQTERDVRARHCYLMRNEAGRCCATFCFIRGDDPTYARIDDGEWLNDLPYGVVHRLASDGTQSGVADACFEWCFARCANLRVDTHADNRVMQQHLTRLGFAYCGIIYCHNGTPRLAYQCLHTPSASEGLTILAADTSSSLPIDYADQGIKAGFPSPAQDYMTESIDLNRELVRHPSTTFYARAVGDSMCGIGIDSGDLLVIDKGIEPMDGDVVVAFIDGEFTLKRFKRDPQGECGWLVPENDAYKPIRVTADNEFMIWGVLTYSIKRQLRR